MNKQTLFTLLYIVLIIGVIAFMIFMVFWLKGESLSCLKDPVGYHIKKTAEVCFCDDGLGLVRG